MSIWKIDQIPPAVHWIHHGIVAISRNINSPANILPKSRSDNDSGLTTSSIILKIKFMGASHIPNGDEKTSLVKLMQPLPLKLLHLYSLLLQA